MNSKFESRLEVQDYLNDHGVKSLSSEFGIKINDYPDDGLMTLNYSVTDSPQTNNIVRECSGLILKNTEPYSVIAQPFFRFFNLGENNEKIEKINDYHIMEKIDGTLITVYHHNDNWHYATKRMAFAEGSNYKTLQFKDLANKALDINKFNVIDTDLTLMFELTSPDNRIVSIYDETKMTLLSVRNNVTGNEFSLDELKIISQVIGVNIPKLYLFESFNDLNNSIEKLPVLDNGYVLWNDKTGHRVKIKNHSYELFQ